MHRSSFLCKKYSTLLPVISGNCFPFSHHWNVLNDIGTVMFPNDLILSTLCMMQLLTTFWLRRYVSLLACPSWMTWLSQQTIVCLDIFVLSHCVCLYLISTSAHSFLHVLLYGQMPCILIPTTASMLCSSLLWQD